jgi:TPP-dependent trihydroxycyclohexane-1,2-dione (THcHDO) dehydratase
MTRKLDQEHLNAIQDLQTKFAQNANTLGAIAIDEYAIEQQLEQLKQAKQDQFTQFNELRKQEDALIEELKARYGEGQINIQDGTFTPDN